jgi:hypothetical protein
MESPIEHLLDDKVSDDCDERVDKKHLQSVREFRRSRGRRRRRVRHLQRRQRTESKHTLETTQRRRQNAPKVREVVALDESAQQLVALLASHHRFSCHQIIHLTHYGTGCGHRRRPRRRGRRHDNRQRCRRRRRVSSAAVAVVHHRRRRQRVRRVVADASLLSTAAAAVDVVIARTRERRLENAGAASGHVVGVQVVVVDDECRLLRRLLCRPVDGFLVFPVLDFVEVVNGAGVAATGHAVLAHGRQHHSLSQTLLEATVLATVALLLRYDALAVGDARVDALVLHRALEEALTALARDYAVVETRRAVLANHANHRRIRVAVLQLLRRDDDRVVVVVRRLSRRTTLVDEQVVSRRRVHDRDDGQRLGVGLWCRRRRRRTVGRVGERGRRAVGVVVVAVEGDGRRRPHHRLVAVALTRNVAHKERRVGRALAASRQIETLVARPARRRRRRVVRPVVVAIVARLLSLSDDHFGGTQEDERRRVGRRVVGDGVEVELNGGALVIVDVFGRQVVDFPSLEFI